jgi:hypothetical protein
MPTVTSTDGTNIAFDRVGSGPAAIIEFFQQEHRERKGSFPLNILN